MNIFKKFVNLITEEPEVEEEENIKIEKIEPEVKKIKSKKITREELENDDLELTKTVELQKTVELEKTKELERTRDLDRTRDLERTVELEKTKEIKERPTREKIKTPFFDEDDFEDLEDRRPKRVEKKKEQPVVKKEVEREPKLYGGSYTTGSYTSPSILTQEKPTFKPTPVISPVFGILDKNYSKEDIVEKKEQSSYTTSPTRRDKFDEVRNKAYGTLEDDIEDVVYYPTEEKTIEKNIDLFDELETDNYKTVEIEDTTNLSETISKQEENIKELEEITMDLTKELDNLLLKKDSFKEKKAKIEKESDDQLSENELFNLIDSMYEERRD